MSGFNWPTKVLAAALCLGLAMPATAGAVGGDQIRFGDGTEQTVVQVLSWSDGLPELAEIRRPDGSTEVRVLDRGCLGGVRWVAEAGSDDRQGRGRLITTHAGIERTIALDYRASRDGLGLEFVDENDPSIRGSAMAVGIERPILSRERIGTHNPVLVILVLCALLQADAQDRCLDKAERRCGAENVESAEYTGLCGGFGRCEYECEN